MGGSESMVTGLLSEGILAPLETAMILPEIRDPNSWWGGHIWVDNAKRYIYASHAYQVELIWRNTDDVKPEEIRFLTDLLNPNGPARSATSIRALPARALRCGLFSGSSRGRTT
jgi:hypothetical protein